MRYTLRDIFEHSVKSYEAKPRDEWVFDWPAQPALVGTQIWWTTETNQAFEKLEEGRWSCANTMEFTIYPKRSREIKFKTPYAKKTIIIKTNA